MAEPTILDIYQLIMNLQENLATTNSAILKMNDTIYNMRAELIQKIDDAKNELRTEFKEQLTKSEASIKKFVKNEIANVNNEVANEISDLCVLISPLEKRVSNLEEIARANGYAIVCEDSEEYKV